MKRCVSITCDFDLAIGKVNHNPPPNFAEAGFSVFQRCLFGLVTIFPLQRGPIGQIST